MQAFTLAVTEPRGAQAVFLCSFQSPHSFQVDISYYCYYSSIFAAVDLFYLFQIGCWTVSPRCHFCRQAGMAGISGILLGTLAFSMQV